MNVEKQRNLGNICFDKTVEELVAIETIIVNTEQEVDNTVILHRENEASATFRWFNNCECKGKF